MIAVDTNILVYAHRADSSWHEPASSVITELAEGQSPWAIPWPCIYEFLAIVTHPRIYKPPTPVEDALVQVDRWLESPSVHLISDDDAFFEVVRPIVKASGVRGGAVHDARIVALCVYHGVKKLLTADRDFSRFPQVRTENPLIKRKNGERSGS